MLIRDLFAANVTRDIPPVVYFHEQSPAKLQAEVSEYIITGGFPDGDPRAGRYTQGGIHEQFVRLLRNVVQELGKKGGPELPASWISGCYGSGKSSFAKLLGLALDGVVLPDGTALDRALIARDDSPKRSELVSAWEALRKRVNPMAVVFDIGGVARDDEHIHSAVLRQVQVRLGYCSKSNLVADYELRLQKAGEWARFLATARVVLGKDWQLAKEEELADDHFSHVLHVMDPSRYLDPTSWIDSRAGSRTGGGSSVREAVDAIDAMMSLWAEGKALFIVVDEVSQYVHQDANRMLKLQSFISELGQRMKGGVWLLATGQQKLEDQTELHGVGKLKDRFPPSLRVHLGNMNIRDVIHKRLLKKKPEHEATLRTLFQKHRSDLKLFAYACEEITEEDFVEVYPMLPGHIDLLMEITSNLRTRSNRIQGDDHAIRGLLQLLGELFRERRLADQEVGKLVTLDAIFEVQHTALDADVRATFLRLPEHVDPRADALAIRAAKAVALLEQVQEGGRPTTPELVAQCLYAELGLGSQVSAVSQALEKLRGLNLLSYSEREGYKLQTSTGQEWQREREDHGVASEAISIVVQDTLKNLIGSLQERPKYQGRTFPWSLWFSDGRHANDVRLADSRESSTVAVDFRFLGRKEERTHATWVQQSALEQLANRILWVVGDSDVAHACREEVRSKKMVEKYQDRWASLPKAKQQLLLQEQARLAELEAATERAVANAFFDGVIYFRGQQLCPKDLAGAFGPAAVNVANRLLPDLYPYASELPGITKTELLQLLEKDLAGPSTKFLEGGLGILSLDDQRYVATCRGEHPKRLAQEIQKTGGLSGQSLVATFMAPPYGYPVDLVQVCCAGLLRGKHLRVRTEAGEEITSYKDAGVKDLFTKDQAFRKADFFPPAEDPVGPRDRVAIAKFFESALDVRLERDDEAFADATFLHFPHLRTRLCEVEKRYEDLPGRPPVSQRLARLAKALEDCRRHRPIQKIVLELKRNLEALRDGMTELRLLESELTPEALMAVKQAARARDCELAQLSELSELGELEAEAEAIDEQLRSERPWRGIPMLEDGVARVRERYVEVRRNTLARQNAEAEKVQARIRMAAGFEKLDPDQAHTVMKPILDARSDTTPEAVSPTLAQLRDAFASRIGPAEDRARDRLDEVRIKDQGEPPPVPIVKLEASLRGREIQTRAELQALLRELEQRIGELLDRGERVRLL